METKQRRFSARSAVFFSSPFTIEQMRGVAKNVARFFPEFQMDMFQMKDPQVTLKKELCLDNY